MQLPQSTYTASTTILQLTMQKRPPYTYHFPYAGPLHIYTRAAFGSSVFAWPFAAKNKVRKCADAGGYGIIRAEDRILVFLR